MAALYVVRIFCQMLWGTQEISGRRRLEGGSSFLSRGRAEESGPQTVQALIWCEGSSGSRVEKAETPISPFLVSGKDFLAISPLGTSKATVGWEGIHPHSSRENVVSHVLGHISISCDVI